MGPYEFMSFPPNHEPRIPCQHFSATVLPHCLRLHSLQHVLYKRLLSQLMGICPMGHPNCPPDNHACIYGLVTLGHTA